jgi:ribose transport system permease protein
MADSTDLRADLDAARVDAEQGDAEQGDAGPFDEMDEERSSLLRRVLTANTSWTLLVLFGLVLGFTLMRPTQFGTLFNFRNIAIDGATLLVMSVGMTFVIITGGIDLSIGSVLIFSGVIAAKVMAGVEHSTNGSVGQLLLGVAAALAVGLGWGLLNGVLIAKGRIPALIVTLGTLGMALGAAQLITGGIDVRGLPLMLGNTIGNGDLQLTGMGFLLRIPWIVFVAAGVTIVGAIALAATRFGRHTYAIGSNPEAARRAGIAVDRQLIKIYGLSGLLAGLAGFLNLAHFTTTTLAGHSTDNLQAIAAVVIGGTSLFGGIGSILGTVVGVFIPAVLQNGFVILGVQAFWQPVAVGAVLIAAVYVDQVKRRSRERG